MPQNLKKGSFVIREETPKDPSTLGNVLTRKTLIDFWGQKDYDDVTNQLRQVYINSNSTEQAQPTPFTNWLEGTGRTIRTRYPKIRYRKIAQGKVHFRIQKTTSLTTPGLFFEPFEIILNTNLFKDGDRIRPEDAPNQQLVVQGPGRPVGVGTAYTVMFQTRNKNSYFHPQYLVNGTRFVKAGASVYGERSKGWGSSMWEHGKSVLVYEVPLFKTGKEMEITDEALNHVFAVDTVNNQDKPTVFKDMPESAITAAELNFMGEIAWEKEQDLIWGVASEHIPDVTTTKNRQIGAGIFDFLKDGHIYKYSPSNSSIKEFTDFLRSVWHSSAGTVVFGTGRPGLELADEWIRREFSDLNVITDFDEYVKKGGTVTPGGREAWTLMKPMFNAYELPVWGLVVFEHWPALDNREMRGPRHPKTGEPILGYHFIATRYKKGKDGIKANISMVHREGAYIWGYESGAVGPNGPINDRKGGAYKMAHGGRFTTLRHGDGYGLFMDDINDFVWFQPNIR